MAKPKVNNKQIDEVVDQILDAFGPIIDLDDKWDLADLVSRLAAAQDRRMRIVQTVRKTAAIARSA